MANDTPDRGTTAGVFRIEGMRADAAHADAELVRLGLLPVIDGELERTEREERAIDAAFAVLSRLYRELGLIAPVLDARRIHVLGEVEFMRRWGPDRRAFTQFGHVYLARHVLFVHFLQDLTHELVHAASLRAVIDPSAGPERAIVHVRSGFSPLDGRADTRRWRFIGLNEGVTEMIAVEVRRRMDGTDLGLSPDMARVFADQRMYPGMVRFAEALVAAAGDGVRSGLFADYLTRSFRTVRALARTFPGSIAAVASVETGREALEAAEKLGLIDAAVDIRRMLVRRRRR